MGSHCLCSFPQFLKNSSIRRQSFQQFKICFFEDAEGFPLLHENMFHLSLAEMREKSYAAL